MSSSFPSPRVSMAVLSLVLASMMIGCKSDPAAPNTSVITDDDAANLFAAALGHQSGGFLMQIGDAVAVAHGAPLPASAEKKPGASILRDTTVDRNRTVTTAGKTYAINYKARYVYAYTSNNFNNPKDYFFLGNTELRWTPSIVGTMTLPLVSASDSAGADIFMNHTDSTMYIINGSFRRIGTYTLTGTGRTFTGTIKSEGIPGATVDPATQELVYGDIEVSLKGKDGNGAAVEWGAVYVFRIGQQPQLNLNGKYYLLNTLTGEASLR